MEKSHTKDQLKLKILTKQNHLLQSTVTKLQYQVHQKSKEAAAAVKAHKICEQERLDLEKRLFEARLRCDHQYSTILRMRQESSVSKLEEEIYTSRLQNLYTSVQSLSSK